MFAKTYRVHRIFTHSWSGICKDKMLKDTKLISLVGALLLLDGLVVTFWVITDPMERHLSNLTLEISTSDRSVVYQPQVIYTNSFFRISMEKCFSSILLLFFNKHNKYCLLKFYSIKICTKEISF